MICVLTPRNEEDRRVRQCPAPTQRPPWSRAGAAWQLTPAIPDREQGRRRALLTYPILGTPPGGPRMGGLPGGRTTVRPPGRPPRVSPPLEDAGGGDALISNPSDINHGDPSKRRCGMSTRNGRGTAPPLTPGDPVQGGGGGGGGWVRGEVGRAGAFFWKGKADRMNSAVLRQLVPGSSWTFQGLQYPPRVAE